MFEMTVSTVKARSKDITFLIERLRPAIKSLKGIMVCEEFDGRIKLAMAVGDNKKDYFLGLIFDAVCETVIRGYKEEFLKENIKLKISSKVAFETFIKALTMFDKVGDKEIIKKQLSPSGEINIDSLYNFRLWELTKRWQEICTLVSDNSGYLLASGTFMELMRFLLATNEAEMGKVSIYGCRGKIKGIADNGQELFKLTDTKDELCKISLLSELISLAPEKIVLCDGVPIELGQLVKSLFDGKVSQLEKKC